MVNKVVLLPRLGLTVEAPMRTYNGRKGPIAFWPVQAAKDLHPVDAFEIDFFVDGWGRLRPKQGRSRSEEGRQAENRSSADCHHVSTSSNDATSLELQAT
jgi:hypothetical protein